MRYLFIFDRIIKELKLINEESFSKDQYRFNIEILSEKLRLAKIELEDE